MEAYLIASLVVAAGLGFIPASIAKNKGYDIDKPRNLAKSVTVE